MSGPARGRNVPGMRPGTKPGVDRRPTTAVLAGGVAAVLSAVALAGCGVAGRHFSDERTDEVAVTEITIDGGSGSVTVAPGSDGSVRVQRRVSYGARKPAETARIDGTVLRLDTDCGFACSVSYTVTAPPNVRVSGRNGSGAVDLRGVSSVAVSVGSGAVRVHDASGDVSVETNSGSIAVQGVRGNVRAHAGSGAITLTEVSGTVIADTSSGAIRGRQLSGSRTDANTSSGSLTLELASAQDVIAETSSGSVHVTVPAGTSYRVNARTSSGRTTVTVPTSEDADHTITASSSSGSVTVDTR
jgi:DUF4097 and DUF4098 domain-containing protein YvlB